jgi:hypothetical protein
MVIWKHDKDNMMMYSSLGYDKQSVLSQIRQT